MSKHADSIGWDGVKKLVAGVVLYGDPMWKGKKDSEGIAREYLSQKLDPDPSPTSPPSAIFGS
jgi:hypothetical protein